jgi:hypothetical protein
LYDSLLAVRSAATRFECHAHGPHDHSYDNDDNEKPNQRVERAGNVEHDESTSSMTATRTTRAKDGLQLPCAVTNQTWRWTDGDVVEFRNGPTTKPSK